MVQDEGSQCGSEFRLNTASFSKEENLCLIEIIKEMFELECTLNFNCLDKGCIPYLITAESMSWFRELVLPFCHESMKYKLA